MSHDKREVADFFRIVHRGIQKYGIRRITKLIEEIDLQENNSNFNLIYDYIVEAVCSEYDITRDDLMHSTKRGEITIARKVCFVIIKQNLSISNERLAKNFGGRVRQVINNAMSDFKELDRESKADAPFLACYDKVNNQVVKYVEQLKEVDTQISNGSDKQKTEITSQEKNS